MICGLLSRKIRYFCRSVFRFLDASVSPAMGCFFACFRVKDNSDGGDGDRLCRIRRRQHSLFVSDSVRSKQKEETVVSRNRLSTLFLAKEEEADSVRHDVENPLYLRSPRTGEDQLRDEAKFLKGCGTLPDTPAEIRRASAKLKGSPTVEQDSQPSKFHSWLPNTSIKKLQFDKQADQPTTPIKLCEELERNSISSEQTPTSCISKLHNSGGISTSPDVDNEAVSNASAMVQASKTDSLTTPLPPPTDVQHKNKSVRFECDPDTTSSQGSSSEGGYKISKKFESAGELSVSKPSPKPTPLKLSDEMQTPGTVFPANVDNLGIGKTKVRSQYVYSVFNPVENVSNEKELKEDSDSRQESSDHCELETPGPEARIEKNPSGKEQQAEASLTSWLKPPASNNDGDDPSIATASGKNFRFRRTPGDRPIIGMVAAHWNENETSQISPKWWDGNGIPNSTNKYKEDQKVSWHATPFEERLEKALSEESLTSQRKHISEGPILFDEHSEESDTAMSQFQASAHTKSVVSF